jgi:CPA1 family monovalent cation:H+ antiporter
MQGMLSYLLFAGALHVNLADLKGQRWIVSILATVGVIISTTIVAILTWFLLGALGIKISFLYCLVFGALISPTDPIAVLSIMKKVGAPKSIETKISGESLFNDGVGVVVFLVLAGLAAGNTEINVQQISLLFVKEAIGGAVFGFALGYLGFLMLRSVDNYSVEILITLAMVSGGYALAIQLHVSGPIAVVVAGLIIGNHGRRLAMTERTREHIDTFWHLVDEVLNAVLFVMIGLEVLVLTITQDYLIAAICVIPIVLFARFISVGTPVLALRMFREFSPKIVRILTWAGIRGGISVALVLSLKQSETRNVLLTMTYAVVVFSILVQGLTISRLIRSAKAE